MNEKKYIHMYQYTYPTVVNIIHFISLFLGLNSMHFIKVTLAASGGEGGRSMGAMRWAQTANYGVAPNPAMPRTSLGSLLKFVEVKQWNNVKDVLGGGNSNIFHVHFYLRNSCNLTTIFQMD